MDFLLNGFDTPEGALFLTTLTLTLVALFFVWQSFWVIGPTDVGLVRKRFSRRKLEGGNPVAFRGEAGYQGELLMPGIRFKFRFPDPDGIGRALHTNV